MTGVPHLLAAVVWIVTAAALLHTYLNRRRPRPPGRWPIHRHHGRNP